MQWRENILPRIEPRAEERSRMNLHALYEELEKLVDESNARKFYEKIW